MAHHRRMGGCATVLQLWDGGVYGAYSRSGERRKQGTISGLLGMSLPLGIVVGMVLMTLLTDVSSAAKWTLIAAIGIVGPIISLFLIQEGKVEIISENNTVVPLREKLSKIYPSPRRFPAFSWAVASKFLMMMGYCAPLPHGDAR